MKHHFLFLCLLIASLDVSAQVSEGGLPYSFRTAAGLKSEIPVIAMPAFDLEKLIKEDEINDKRKDIPWRFGHNFSVNINPDNSGQWEMTADGDRIWRLKIYSENAVSINIIFGEFYIPQGGKVFLYDPGHTQVLGAFTEKNNLPHRKLGVDLIPGESLIIEYVEPAAMHGRGKLAIEQITHGYRGMPDESKDFGDSGPCNNNVVCPEGAPWQDQIRATAMNLVNGNTWCSGALINNTCQDGTPYYLTADHCLSGSVSSWVFRFNYESPNCTPSNDGPYNFTVSGATLRANNGASDFALLELSSAPPSGFNVFYAGWDRSGNIPQKQVGIHHPSGDVKKISFDDEPAIDTINYGINVWMISSWNDGTTEGGSSGSPLFDQNKRIIGQLYGGSASCSNLSDDNYGKLSVSWDYGGSPSTQLKDWLDLCNTSEVSIDGFDPNFSVLQYDAATQFIGGISSIYCGSALDSITPYALIGNKGTDTLTKITIVFEMDSTSDSLIWNGVLLPNNSETVYFNSFYPTAGNHTFTVTVKNPNDTTDQKVVNDTKSISFNFITNSYNAFFTLKTDNYGSETSWQLKDSLGEIWYSGGGYQDIQGGEIIIDTFCFSAGCYDFVINDSYGDGLSGNGGTGTQGAYYFQDNGGDTMASINNVNFGYSETNSFCFYDTSSSEINFSISSAITCYGNCNGSVSAQPLFGTAPYTFQWSANTGSQTTQSVTGLCAGTFQVTITDSTGIVRSASYLLSGPQQLVSTPTISPADSGNCNGAVSLTVTGGTPPYSYSWSNGSFTPGISNLCEGSYFVTITDTAGCFITDSVTVTAVGIPLLKSGENSFTVFPNPSAGIFSVLASRPQFPSSLNVKIYNILGELILLKSIKEYKSPITLDLTNLPAGIYYARLENGINVETIKIIISHN